MKLGYPVCSSNISCTEGRKNNQCKTLSISGCLCENLCLQLGGFKLVLGWFFIPGHCGLSLKVSFIETDIQRLYLNKQRSLFLNIRKNASKKACSTCAELSTLKLEYSTENLWFFQEFWTPA